LGHETEIVQAFRETESGLSQLDEVDIGDLDRSVDSANRLQQQLENQQPRLGALQTEIRFLQQTCTADEARILAQKSKELEQTTKVSELSLKIEFQCMVL